MGFSNIKMTLQSELISLPISSLSFLSNDPVCSLLQLLIVPGRNASVEQQEGIGDLVLDKVGCWLLTLTLAWWRDRLTRLCRRDVHDAWYEGSVRGLWNLFSVCVLALPEGSSVWSWCGSESSWI